MAGPPKKPERARPLAEATKQRARLAAAQADVASIKAAKMRGELVPAEDVEREWSGVLRTIRAGVLAISSRVAQRCPQLDAHAISEIDLEARAVLAELGGGASGACGQKRTSIEEHSRRNRRK